MRDGRQTVVSVCVPLEYAALNRIDDGDQDDRVQDDQNEDWLFIGMCMYDGRKTVVSLYSTGMYSICMRDGRQTVISVCVPVAYATLNRIVGGWSSG